MSRPSPVTREHAQLRPEAAPVLRAKAPLRVSFAGGGTDVPPFPEMEGGLVLSATINRYAHGLLKPRADQRITVESHDLQTAIDFQADEAVPFDGQLDLIKAAIRRVADLEQSRGFDLFLNTSAPPGSGLGASSALMVALIAVLGDQHRLKLSQYEIAELAYVVEREDLGIKGGLQDQYAAAFGGFNFIEFHADRVVVNPLRIPPSTLNELEENLVLCFTGATRKGDHIIEDQTNRFVAGEADTLAGMRRQKTLAVELKEALVRGQLTLFGELMDEAWQEKKKMSPRISTPAIDEAYAAACAAGAIGGKVTGAGGGGFMLFYCRAGTRHRVESELRTLDFHPAEFAFDTEGVRTWSYVDRR